jgi:AraC-like DNA-binding protein
MREVSISVYFARAVLRNAVKVGIDPVALLKKNRIPPRLLLENNARISAERFADLQVTTMLAMNDESLGYAARPMPIGCWSMMCHAVINCETLGQAMSRYCRYFQLFDSGATPHFHLDDDNARITIEGSDNSLQLDPYFCELTLFNTHRFSSWLVKEHLPIQQVKLAYPPAAQINDYRHIFLGNPVAFEQQESSLSYSPALLEKRITQNEQTLRHFLKHPSLFMLTKNYAQNNWTSRVRDIIRHNLSDMPELNAVADAMDVHPQTLRRRLAGEGTTFKELKNQVRRDTALHFLGKQGLSIEEIAHRAGFSESSAFIRAFKGWTGVTPYSYRKGL